MSVSVHRKRTGKWLRNDADKLRICSVLETTPVAALGGPGYVAEAAFIHIP